MWTGPNNFGPDLKKFGPFFKNVHVLFISLFFRGFIVGKTENGGLFYPKLLSLSY